MRAFLVVVVVIGLLIVALAACGPDGYYEDPAAQRLNAEANLTRAAGEAAAAQEIAKGEADAARTAAKTEQAERLAASRQMERDAAHQRTMDALPFVLLVLGSMVIVVLAVLMFWDLRTQRQAQQASNGVVYLLERQAERERQLWHAIGLLSRRPSRGVVLYDGDGREIQRGQL